jgi:hypothetical protein
VRIGGKPNQTTAELSLHSLGRSSSDVLSRSDWNKIEALRKRRAHLSKSLHRAYCAATARHKQIMRHLEAHHQEYAAAFCIPESTDGTKIIGKGGRVIGPDYLLDRWLKGQTRVASRTSAIFKHMGIFGKWRTLLDFLRRKSGSEKW